MASPAELIQSAPDTLPEDFSEWDNGESTDASPANSNGVEAAPEFREEPKPPVQAAKPPAPAVKPSAPAAKPPAPAAKPRIGMAQPMDRVRSTPVPSLAPAAAYADAEAFFQPLRSNAVHMGGLSILSHEDEPEAKGKNKMLTMGIPIGVVVLLLALIPIVYPRLMAKGSAPKPSVQQQSVAVAQAAPQAAPQLTTTPVALPPPPSQSAANAQTPAQPRVQSAMMSSQLSAPAVIPHDAKTVAAQDAPPAAGFGNAGMEGLGGNNAIGGVFNGQGNPKVKIELPKKVSISAGVAVGLLVQKTAPVYPQIAKTARVSGTVVLQATISKNGSIQNLRAVSGPEMLRQAAVDAVRSWRYRPYKLNNDPVEVDTTINVIFALGG
jgi:protein TonB